MKNKKALRILTPILVSLLFIILGVVGLLQTIDYFIFDTQMRLSKSPKESEKLLLIDIDDAAIDPNTGISTWPIPREYYGDALLTLKEFKAESALFDIEFLGRSQLEFSPEDFELRFVNPVKQKLSAIQENVNHYLAGMFAEYYAGRISAEQFKAAISDVVVANGAEVDTIQTLLQDFSFDRDNRLAKGAEILGNTYFAASLRKFEGEGTHLSKEEIQKNQQDYYNFLTEQILYLVDAAPELITGDISKFLNRTPFNAVLSALEPKLASLNADSDLNQIARETATELNISLNENEYQLLANPSVLALSYEIRALLQTVSLSNVKEHGNAVENFPFIDFPTDVVLRGAKGIAFSNVKIDPDGTRRRVQLLSKTGDFYYPQLGFATLLPLLKNPTIEAYPNKIELVNAVLPGSETPKKITIPLDKEGCMLINWPHKRFVGKRDAEGKRLKGVEGEDSFQHLSFLKLYKTISLEQPLYQFLSECSQNERYQYYAEWQPLLEIFELIDQTRRELLMGEYSEDLMEQYRMLKNELDTQLEKLHNPPVLGLLMHEIGSGSYSQKEVEEMKAMQADVEAASAELGEWLAAYQEARSDCKELIKDRVCIVGFTASSTTDFGVTPFQEDYPNVGTHASAINTILQEDFLHEIPIWVSVLLTLILTFALYFALRPLAPGFQILVGFLSIIILIFVDWLVFFCSGYFLPIFMPVMSMFVTFVVETAVQLITTSKEKNYVRKAFSHYLSNDVINEIMKDPDKLKLGGEARYMTAVFTDVKGFSTISEQLTAEELVTLLNAYLSKMSDIILDLRGLIDKYEGDAIIAFFGAPNELKEHAYNTCLAAVRMHRIEAELNKQFLAEKMTPSPLLTRIGINTGEMVVGNMGTATKMNYTMMGSAVNLAARLEGVNKQYGTWILMSGETYNAGGNQFFTRRIDRVRVVGIHEPVQLYELIEEECNVTAEMRKGVEVFHKALDLYEKRDWTAAIAKFKEVLQWLPEDGPALTYIARCEVFEKRPPAADWDGVNNLTSK